MKRIIAAALAAAAIASLSGCAAAQTDQAAAAPEAKPAAATCETPSKALLTTIGSVLDSGVKVGHAAAVRSSEFEKAWFVAVQLKGESMADSDPAVFVTNDLGGGTMYAVGGMAHEFSDLGHGEDTDAEFAQTSAGYADAIACVKAAA